MIVYKKYIVKCHLCNQTFPVEAQDLKNLDQKMRDHVRNTPTCYNELLRRFRIYSSNAPWCRCGNRHNHIFQPDPNNSFRCNICGCNHFNWYFGVNRPYSVLCPNCRNWVLLMNKDINRGRCPECECPL